MINSGRVLRDDTENSETELPGQIKSRDSAPAMMSNPLQTSGDIPEVLLPGQTSIIRPPHLKLKQLKHRVSEPCTAPNSFRRVNTAFTVLLSPVPSTGPNSPRVRKFSEPTTTPNENLNDHLLRKSMRKGKRRKSKGAKSVDYRVLSGNAIEAGAFYSIRKKSTSKISENPYQWSEKDTLEEMKRKVQHFEAQQSLEEKSQVTNYQIPRFTSFSVKEEPREDSIPTLDANLDVNEGLYSDTYFTNLAGETASFTSPKPRLSIKATDAPPNSPLASPSASYRNDCTSPFVSNIRSSKSKSKSKSLLASPLFLNGSMAIPCFVDSTNTNFYIQYVKLCTYLDGINKSFKDIKTPQLIVKMINQIRGISTTTKKQSIAKNQVSPCNTTDENLETKKIDTATIEANILELKKIAVAGQKLLEKEMRSCWSCFGFLKRPHTKNEAQCYNLIAIANLDDSAFMQEIENAIENLETAREIKSVAHEK